LTIFYLGWIERFKGIFELLEAVLQLKNEPAIPQFNVVFGGGGGALQEAKYWAMEHNIDDQISFLGWLTQKECLMQFEKSDIFVLPSYTEGLPNAMIEAMAAGKPIVVTPVGSIPDVIEDGINGLIIQPGNVNSLKDALSRLLCDPLERYKLGKEARKVAAERFRPEKAASGLVNLLTQAVQSSENCKI
jgi:glycosyltransferase involved in cell wall biosynthesis